VILNTYTDITTTTTQKLDLKYIHRYNTTATQKLDLKYIHMYLRSSFGVAVVLYLCMYLRSSFCVAVVVISVYVFKIKFLVNKCFFLSYSVSCSVSLHGEQDKKKNAFSEKMHDLKYIHRYNYYGNQLSMGTIVVVIIW
jgi:hypothetical protein